MSAFFWRRSSWWVATARGCTCVHFHPSLGTLSFSRRNLSAPSCVPRSYCLDASTPRPRAVGYYYPSHVAFQLNCFSSSRTPWQNNRDWKSVLKTGGLVVVGTGALLASTSLAIGFFLAGAAGFGVYSLYQRFFGRFRAPIRPSSDPLRHLDDVLRRRRPRHASAVQNEVESLVQGLPMVVRGFVTKVFAFVGKALQSSLETSVELRRQTTEHLRANQRVCDVMGNDVSVGPPVQWIESTVNGVGSLKAVLPVKGTAGSAHVTVKALVGQGRQLELTALQYYHRPTGDTIDLLRPSSSNGPRKTVIEAEYVDVDHRGKSR